MFLCYRYGTSNVSSVRAAEWPWICGHTRVSTNSHIARRKKMNHLYRFILDSPLLHTWACISLSRFLLLSLRRWRNPRSTWLQKESWPVKIVVGTYNLQERYFVVFFLQRIILRNIELDSSRWLDRRRSLRKVTTFV